MEPTSSVAHSLFIKNIVEHQEVVADLKELSAVVGVATCAVCDSLRDGFKLMLCGNGGSAADSQHLAAEFTGRFVKDRRPLAALALSTDTSALTCISNDYSYSEVFSRQVVALGLAGDCLLAISTSGNSESVVRAVLAARKMGIKTIGLLGRDGGILSSLCDCSIVVRSNTTARIQEAHILIGHTICGAVEQMLGLVEANLEQ